MVLVGVGSKMYVKDLQVLQVQSLKTQNHLDIIKTVIFVCVERCGPVSAADARAVRPAPGTARRLWSSDKLETCFWGHFYFFKKSFLQTSLLRGA